MKIQPLDFLSSLSQCSIHFHQCKSDPLSCCLEGFAGSLLPRLPCPTSPLAPDSSCPGYLPSQPSRTLSLSEYCVHPPGSGPLHGGGRFPSAGAPSSLLSENTPASVWMMRPLLSVLAVSSSVFLPHLSKSKALVLCLGGLARP